MFAVSEVTMILREAWKDSYKREIIRHSVSVLRLSESAGWSGEDLSYLAELQNLRGIEIYDNRVKDLTPIESLNKLELISFECNIQKPLNAECFTNLRFCMFDWVKGKNLEGFLSLPHIERFIISKFPYSNLILFRSPKFTEIQL